MDIKILKKDSGIKLQIYVHPTSIDKARNYAVQVADDILSVIHEDDKISPSTFYVVDQRFPQVTSHNF